MRSRSNYWSCTNFAAFISGKSKPINGLTAEEWDEWETTASTAHPIRFWIADVALNKIQNFINWPLDKILDIKYYVNNRFITKSHQLTATSNHLTPGKWCDVGDRFLPCLFDTFVDFIEIEKAWMMVAFDSKNISKEKYKTPIWASGIFRLRCWRSPEAGIDYLKWEMSLVNDENGGFNKLDKRYGRPTHQAIAAKEMFELYIWYKETYLTRPDVYDITGWTAHCDEKSKNNSGKLGLFKKEKSEQEKIEVSKMLDNIRTIEDEREKEDTEMLTRLIAIRHSLWT